jgi:hypothetical protein
MRARVWPAAGDERASRARAASATTGESTAHAARATSGRVVGVREYGRIAALAMATRGEGNDGQTATLVMDKHNEGEDGQIAGTRGDGSATMGESSRSRWPRAARAMTSESPACVMVTRGKGDDGQIAGAHGDSDVGQVDGMRGEWDQNNNHPTTDGGVRWRWHRTTMHQSN